MDVERGGKGGGGIASQLFHTHTHTLAVCSSHTSTPATCSAVKAEFPRTGVEEMRLGAERSDGGAGFRAVGAFRGRAEAGRCGATRWRCASVNRSRGTKKNGEEGAQEGAGALAVGVSRSDPKEVQKGRCSRSTNRSGTRRGCDQRELHSPPRPPSRPRWRTKAEVSKEAKEANEAPPGSRAQPRRAKLRHRETHVRSSAHPPACSRSSLLFLLFLHSCSRTRTSTSVHHSALLRLPRNTFTVRGALRFARQFTLSLPRLFLPFFIKFSWVLLKS